MTGSRRKKAPAEADPDEVRSAALRLLARREYAVAELRGRLLRRGYPEDLVEEVLGVLQADGLQDERRFVESFLATRSARGDGPLKLWRELAGRGVAESLIRESLDPDDAAWLEQLEGVRRKRFGPALPDSYAEWARQARFLQRRGFSTEQIRRALRRDF
ncbi:MAG TPA: regulatory protein RecX [Gammaproteobacteria bacterium]|nr:regulatory protein RecX [Gammaproteobacteria bacterium]